MEQPNKLPLTKEAFAPLTTTEQKASCNVVALPATNQFVTPVPDNAPEPTFKHYELGQPVKVWPYSNQNGQLMFYVCRFEKDGQKHIRSYICIKDASGKLKWTFKWMPKDRPLLNAPKVTKSRFVAAFEGEPAADAFQQVIKEITATSFSGGCQRIPQTDFSSLKDTNVFYMRDNDPAGEAAESEFSNQAYQAGAKQVFVLTPDAMADEQFCEGWDIADGVQSGWKRNDIEAFMKQNMILAERPTLKPETTDDGFPFKVDETGLYYLETDKKGGISPVLISSPIKVLAKSRDFSGKNWGYQVEITDKDNKRHQEFIPASWFSRKGNDVLDLLYSYDCPASNVTNADKRILQYIRECPTAKRIRQVQYPGWQGNVFVTPEKVYGATDDEKVVMTNDNKITMAQSGTLEEWQENIAQYAEGNSRMVFAMCAALAGPLLHLMGRENSCFHFRGDSSIGKTTLLNTAASIFGMEVQQWRSTDNHQEITNANHNHLPLFMDELAQLSQDAAEKMPYTIGNGKGKGRMTASGKARDTYEWLLSCLSTGEISMQDKMSEKGSNRKETAGEENRFNDIPAYADKKLGVLETKHDFQDPKSLIEHLNQSCQKYHGVAGDQYLDYITKNKDQVIKDMQSFIEAFEKIESPNDASPQVQRVFSRFLFVAAAGQIGIAAGILPWEISTPLSAVKTCFKAWLDNRGGIYSAEIIQGYKNLKENLQRYSNKHFEDWNFYRPNSPMTYDCWGWKNVNHIQGDEYYVTTTGLKLLTGGIHSQAFKEFLVKEGWLEKQKDGFVVSKRLPNKTRQSVHVITPRFED